MKLCILLIFASNIAFCQAKLSGFIRDGKTNEYIPFASVYLNNAVRGISANAYGFYSIDIPVDQLIEITITSLGYTPQVLIFSLSKSDTLINFEMESQTQQLSEVKIYANDNMDTRDNGHIQLSLSSISETPPLLGEKDALKTLQFLPGVQRSTEGSAALYVRGGSPDQNLILLDEAPVYNTNHLFGFISAFNGDAIKSLDFWKSGFPAKYGGRISSVVDIQMKEGNKEKLSVNGGIGIISSRITIEGPLAKKKIIISGFHT